MASKYDNQRVIPLELLDKKTAAEKRGEYKCVTCGKVYSTQRTKFYYNLSPLYKNNNYYTCTCKACINNLYDYYYTELLSEKESIRRICLKFDYYFHENIYDSVMNSNQSKTISALSLYIKQCSLIQYRGLTYDNTIMEERDLLTNIVVGASSDEDAQMVAWIKRWGDLEMRPQEYMNMDIEYDDWKARCIIEGKAKENIVKGLCITKVLKDRALANGNVELYNKLSDTYRKDLDAADLTPKIETINDKAAEIPLGMMIEKFEKEQPIPKPKPEWVDVNGLRHLITVYFLGHLCKMLGIKNKYHNMYEEEMSRYRVEVPELAEADDEDIFEYISNTVKASEAQEGDSDGS